MQRRLQLANDESNKYVKKIEDMSKHQKDFIDEIEKLKKDDRIPHYQQQLQQARENAHKQTLKLEDLEDQNKHLNLLLKQQSDRSQELLQSNEKISIALQQTTARGK